MSFDVATILSVIAAIAIAGAAIGAAKLATDVAIRAWAWLRGAVTGDYEDELSEDVAMQVDAEIEAEIEGLEREEGESDEAYEDRQESLRQYIYQLSDDELIERYGL